MVACPRFCPQVTALPGFYPHYLLPAAKEAFCFICTDDDSFTAVDRLMMGACAVVLVGWLITCGYSIGLTDEGPPSIRIGGHPVDWLAQSGRFV